MSNPNPLECSTVELLRLQADTFPQFRRFGHPDLERGCRPIEDAEFGTPSVLKAAASLVELVVEYRRIMGSGRALAANQMGVHIAMMALYENPEAGAEGVRIFCNPRLAASRGRRVYPESCMSGLHVIGEVVRPRWIQVPYRTPEGAHEVYEDDTLMATGVQHELDHLGGVICYQRYSPDTVQEVTGGQAEVRQIVEACEARYANLLDNPPSLPPH